MKTPADATCTMHRDSNNAFSAAMALEPLTLVLPSGTIIDTEAHDADSRLRTLEPEIFAGLLKRIMENPESQRVIAHQFSMNNKMGYGLNALVDFASPAQIQAHLIVGSGAATVELLDHLSLKVGQGLAMVPPVVRDLHLKEHAALWLNIKVPMPQRFQN